MGIKAITAWLALVVVVSGCSIVEADFALVSRKDPSKCLTVSRDARRLLYLDECSGDLNRRFYESIVDDPIHTLRVRAFEEFNSLRASGPRGGDGEIVSTWKRGYPSENWRALRITELASSVICKEGPEWGFLRRCITWNTTTGSSNDNVRIEDYQSAGDIGELKTQLWMYATSVDCEKAHYPEYEFETSPGDSPPNVGFKCTACPAGTALDKAGYTLSDCEECEPGAYAPEPGRWSCTKCQPGFAQRSKGMATCNACVPGTYQDEEGQDTCKQCEAGTYSSKYARTACAPCSPGFYQPSPGKNECEPCPAITFARGFGSTSCDPCPGGLAATFDGTSCCPEDEQVTPDLSKCVPIINGTICTFPELVVEALAHGLVTSVASRETAGTLTVCMRALLARREPVWSGLRNAAEAQLEAAYTAVDKSDRETAAAVAHLLASVRYTPSEIAMDGVTSWVPVPGPLPASSDGSSTGSSTSSSSSADVDVDVEAFRAAFGSRSELVDRCTFLVASRLTCGCGRKYVGKGQCSLVGSGGEFAALTSLAAFCSSAVGFIGSRESLELAQFAQHCAVSRAETREWQLRDVRQMLGLLVAVRDVAAAASSNLTAGDFAEEFRLLALNALPLIDRLRSDLNVKEQFAATSALRMARTWDDEAAAVTNFREALRFAELSSELQVLFRGLSELVQAGNEQTMARIAEAEANTNSAIAALGELVSMEASALQQAQQDQFKKTMKGLQSMAASELQAERGRLTVTEERLRQLDLSFDAVVRRIKEEQGQFERIFNGVDELGEELASKSYDFLKCVEQSDLHELAEQRLNAIFNIVKGAVKAIADVGAFVLTGGASKVVQTSARALSEARKLTQTFRASPRAGFSSLKEKIRESDDLPLEVLEHKDGIVALLDEGRELADIFAEFNIKSADSWLEAGQAVFSMAGDAGVPGAEGAAEILGGVLALTRYNDEVDRVKAETEEKLATTREVFLEVSALVEEIATFAATLVLEFCDVMLAADPPATPSVAQSASPTRWADMGNTIIRFLSSTDQYADMQARARRRELNDQVLQISATAQEDRSKRLKLRQLARHPEHVAKLSHEQQQFSRSLKSKNDVPDCNPEPKAAAGLALYELYFESVGDAMVFGEAMHRSMVDLVDLARKTKVMRVQRSTQLANIASWEATEAMLGTTPPTPEGDDALEERYQAFLARLPAVRRLVKHLDVELPDAGAALARIVRYSAGPQSGSEPVGVVREACNFLQYALPEQRDACNFDPGPLLAAPGDPFERIRDQVIGKVLSVLEVPSRSDFVHRLPVDDLLGLRLRYSTGAHETRAVPADAVFELDLRGTNSSVAAKLAACGSEFDLVDIVPVLERVSANADTPLSGTAATSQWQQESTVYHAGPFVKVEKDGRRSAFIVDSEGDKNNQPTLRRLTVVPAAGATSCPSNTRAEFVFRGGAHRGCISGSAVARKSYPLLGRLHFQLPRALVDAINDAPEGDAVELVLYARLRYVHATPTGCELERESLLHDGDDGEGDEELGNDGLEEEDGIATEVAAAAAVGGVALMIAVAVAVTVKRRRQSEQTHQQSEASDEMRKSCDNAIVAVAVAQPKAEAA